VSAYVQDGSDGDGFERSRQRLEALVSSLADPAAGEATHPQLEDRLAVSGRELIRSLRQDHLDLRAGREDRSPDVTGADGLVRTRVENGHERDLATVFGTVRVTRMANRARQAINLYLGDAVLNLPDGKHSHGLRRWPWRRRPAGRSRTPRRRSNVPPGPGSASARSRNSPGPLQPTWRLHLRPAQPVRRAAPLDGQPPPVGRGSSS